MTIVERDVTAEELRRFGDAQRRQADQLGTRDPLGTQVGVVAVEGQAYVGCAVIDAFACSGTPTGWAYLAELFVEKSRRGRGLGGRLLHAIESRAVFVGARHIWTRTAGFEAPGFYRHHGYRICHALERWHRSGHGQVILRKSLTGLLAPDPAPAGPVHLVARLPTPTEFERTREGFVAHTFEFGNPDPDSVRIGFVALDGDTIAGFVSGLADRTDGHYGPWFTLTDLFVDTSARRRGIGSALMTALHDRLRTHQMRCVTTWAPGYFDLEYLRKQGYRVLSQLERWYPGPHARVALRKDLTGAR